MQGALKWIAIPGALIALGAVFADLKEWVLWFDKLDGTIESVEVIEPKVEDHEDVIQKLIERDDDFDRRFEAQDSEQLESDMRLLRECMQEEPAAQDRVRRAYCQQLEADYLGTVP